MSSVRHETAAPKPVKPRLRGVLHQWSAVFAAGAGVILIVMAPTARAAWAAAAYGASVVALLTISAVYHVPTWQPRARAWMRRADHAAIFILIAGTYTAICVLALPPDLSRRLLWMVWIGATAGVAQSLFWVRAPKVFVSLLYIALGWCAVPYLGQLRDALSTTHMVLLAVGGVAYSVGAVAYAAKRPNPVPGVFGYHEVFHALVVIACAAHYALIVQLVKRAH